MTATIDAPVLLLDQHKARRNLDRMVARALEAGVRFRPHFKTHQSHVVGHWFRESGVSAITVSSLAMAEYFAEDGWDDITIAFPFHPGMRDGVNILASRVKLGITLADAAALDGVEFDHGLDVWLKIDVGTHRTGFQPDDASGLQTLAENLHGRSDLHLRGLLAHAGHSYGARDHEAIAQVHQHCLNTLRTLADELADSAPDLEISVGDTPACSTQSDFAGVSEMRPGNFIFYDLSQWQIGSCAIEDIAVAMACPVVSRHPERGQLVVHGGAVHFSKDRMQMDGQTVFGLAARAGEHGWGELMPEVRLVGLSQEHGMVDAPADFIRSVKPGDVLYFLPVHSCLTADVLGYYRTLEGDAIRMMAKLAA